MMRWSDAILIGAAFIACGCAVQGSPFERTKVPTENSVIYVYRPYTFGSSLLRPDVSCGDQQARIGPGGYHAFIVPYGKVTCTVQSNESSDKVELDADPRVQYVKEEIGWGKLMSGQPHLDPVDIDQAQGEIQKCVLEDSKQEQHY